MLPLSATFTLWRQAREQHLHEQFAARWNDAAQRALATADERIAHFRYVGPGHITGGDQGLHAGELPSPLAQAQPGGGASARRPQLAKPVHAATSDVERGAGVASGQIEALVRDRVAPLDVRRVVVPPLELGDLVSGGAVPPGCGAPPFGGRGDEHAD